MGKTRNRKKKQGDEACSKINTIKTCDNSGGVPPWANLTHDVLSLIMMKLGVVDFLPFSGVCKSWRLLALSNKNKFMMSRSPISICISTNVSEKHCYLEDFDGRKSKTILPHSAGRRCIGITCGYFILLRKKSNRLWLVNPITRRKIHFFDIPFFIHEDVIAILVFSPSISGRVLVLLSRPLGNIWYCIAGKQEWTKVSTPFPIYDLIAFKGRIYTILRSSYQTQEVGICELKLYPEPELVLLQTKYFQNPGFKFLKFVSSGENLYLNAIDQYGKHSYKIHEIDADGMKWMSREEIEEEYAIFLSNSIQHVTIIPWGELSSQYGRYVDIYKSGLDKLFHADMWYFFHDCLNANLIHE